MSEFLLKVFYPFIPFYNRNSTDIIDNILPHDITVLLSLVKHRSVPSDMIYITYVQSNQKMHDLYGTMHIFQMALPDAFWAV